MNTARFLKYVWSFYNIIHERVKTQKKRIEDKEKKFKDSDLRSKEKPEVQHISSYNKQKLENEEESKLKTSITGKENYVQKVSPIPNQIKVPVKKVSNIAIQRPAQRRNTIQSLTVL